MEIKRVFANRIRTARIFFIISALYGLALRLYTIVDFIPFKYKNILQSHSHVTFLGWGFLAVITIIGTVYYPKTHTKSKYVKSLFNLMTITLVGMLISFPLQGYKLFSILFLSVFLITSYLYLFFMQKQLKVFKSLSAKFIKTGIYFYFLSSLAIWLVAIITVKYGKIDMYYNTVYFYLHFLYNGFFVFALFGLLLKYFEINAVIFNQKAALSFYKLTSYALIPAYALSLLWNVMPNYVYVISLIAVILQIGSLFYLKPLIAILISSLSSVVLKRIVYFVMVSYGIKIFLQFLSAFPIMMNIAIQFKPYFIIGYLHLFTLGFMSMFIILLIQLHASINFSKLGLLLLMLGILLSELILFTNGSLLLFFHTAIVNVNVLLFSISALMPIGILIIHLKLSKNKKAFDK